MSKENRDDYMALANAHLNDETPTLAAIWRTNVFEFPGLGEEGNEQYGAILKEMSRINHSCRPNCTHNFDIASFSFELRATKTIGVGEEILYSYCNIGIPTENRQAALMPYGFACTCQSCCPTPTN
ncbi:hypothetical protein BDQ17DRAFT_1202347, partial [Cyathus striatus]